MSPALATQARRGSAAYVGYALMATAVWLAWEIVKVPVVERGPVALAVRLAPTSPEVLRRAAEAEFLADEAEDAAALAEASLEKAPFNARALRVRGLVASTANRNEEADQLLTLAGNWSLRDDPAHAWLVNYRLRQGDYASSFAHADTLLRRRVDLYAQVFKLLSQAATLDQRAIGPIAGLLEARPPWRWAFLGHLRRDPAGDAVLLALGLALADSQAPLDTTELSDLYQHWLGEGRLNAMKILRERTGRPPTDRLVANGNFSKPVDLDIVPFGWTLGFGPGLSAEVLARDDDPNNNALRVSYDGYGSTIVASQLLTLEPGRYRLSVREYVEGGVGDVRLQWRINCLETPTEALGLSPPVDTSSASTSWRSSVTSFVIPQEDCTAQYLTLAPAPTDRRSPTTIWYDDVQVAPRLPSATPAG